MVDFSRNVFDYTKMPQNRLYANHLCFIEDLPLRIIRYRYSDSDKKTYYKHPYLNSENTFSKLEMRSTLVCPIRPRITETFITTNFYRVNETKLATRNPYTRTTNAHFTPILL